MTNISEYLNTAIREVIQESLGLSRFNLKELAFLTGFQKSARKAETLRNTAVADIRIPPFLIASIAKECNLHCAGCYNRQRRDYTRDELSSDEWRRIFSEAKQMGISFILLAGGEPFMRRDVIETAASFPGIFFPVFTNGTMFNGDMLCLFDHNRNLMPVLSIEGDDSFTDKRRGEGVSKKLNEAADALKKSKIFWGVSITVTDQNFAQVTSDDFLETIHTRGALVVIFVEYVPVDKTAGLTISKNTGALLAKRVEELRNNTHKLLVISFPGDEELMGGCLAAGRGFFHISHWGGAEPCPFSPYSDMSLKDHTLNDVLNSHLFMSIRENGSLREKHTGGCTLFEQQAKIKDILDVAN